MKRTIFALSLMMMGFMLNAQSLREKGDDFARKGEIGSVAEMYMQCMEIDEKCLNNVGTQFVSKMIKLFNKHFFCYVAGFNNIKTAI